MNLTDTEVNGRIMALSKQREEAMNQVVVLTGQLSIVVEERNSLKKQVEELSGDKPLRDDDQSKL